VKEQLEALINQLVERGVDFEDAVAEFEKKFIRKVLDANKGHRSKTAKALGIHRNTLSRKIAELGLDHQRPRRRRSSR
jgi:Fis family transcriptional regulator, factor for inversion stimulation protein